TSKLKLRSLALRSLWFYTKKVNSILKTNSFDLIYFSTTQFPICILGAYWKHKFNIPYIIDIQDPWHSDYYQDKPKDQRPAKYWFSYRLNKYLEPLALKKVDGLISVSIAYINTLKIRYPEIARIPASVITFGAFAEDFRIAKKNISLLPPAFKKKKGSIHLVYIGRGGNDMQDAVRLLFIAFKNGLIQQPKLFNKLHFHFIGTSYAPNGKGKPSVKPLATELGIEEYIEEQTDRIAYYQSINTLLAADALIVPGSNDSQYTASKIFPYILAKKPLLAIFNPVSSVSEIIQECNAGKVVNLLDSTKAIEDIYFFLLDLINHPLKKNEANWDNFKKYSAENMTKRQCELFERVTSNKL
ncbi:MAG: hypothetical protein JWQ25_1496, partial [Daejeonella sp.]|nr:hypothetical protein [Daejeonella sp.]